MKFYSVEIEKKVLGYLMSTNIEGLMSVQKITVNSFVNEFHKKLFQFMIDCFSVNKQFDVSLIDVKFAEDEHYAAVGGMDYLFTLSDGEAEIEEYQDNLVELYNKRLMLDAIQSSLTSIKTSSFAEVVHIFNEAIEKGSVTVLSDTKKGGEVADELLADVKARHERGDTMVGKRFTDIDELDMGLRGIKKGTFMIIGGDNGSGKSSLGNTIRAFFTKKGIGFYAWSGEMSVNMEMTRLMSAVSGVPTDLIDIGKYLDHKVLTDKVEEARSMILDNTVYDGGGLSIAKLKRIIPSLKRQGIEDFFIDRLELMDEVLASSSGDQIGASTQVSKALRSICTRMGVNIYLNAQFKLARQGMEGQLPTKNRIYGGSQVESAAEVIIGVFRPEVYKQTEYGSDTPFQGQPCKGEALLLVMKNNNGSPLVVRTKFNWQNYLFESIADPTFGVTGEADFEIKEIDSFTDEIPF